MKKNLLKVGGVLCALSLLFGAASCDDSEKGPTEAFGSYEIRGKVVNPDDQPVSNATIVIKKYGGLYALSTTTSNEGDYVVSVVNGEPLLHPMVCCYPAEGSGLRPDSVNLTLKYENGTDEYHLGTAAVADVNFKLKAAN